MTRKKRRKLAREAHAREIEQALESGEVYRQVFGNAKDGRLRFLGQAQERFYRAATYSMPMVFRAR